MVCNWINYIWGSKPPNICVMLGMLKVCLILVQYDKTFALHRQLTQRNTRNCRRARSWAEVSWTTSTKRWKIPRTDKSWESCRKGWTDGPLRTYNTPSAQSTRSVESRICSCGLHCFDGIVCFVSWLSEYWNNWHYNFLDKIRSPHFPHFAQHLWSTF